MVVKVKLASIEKWTCYRGQIPSDLPEQIVIDTLSMRQTEHADVDDMETHVPERTFCGGRFWLIPEGYGKGQWICEHMLEID